MIEAVIFDFDGVILDSEPLHFEANRHVFSTLGLTLTYNQYQSRYLGYTDKDLFRNFLASNGIVLTQIEIDSLIAKKHDHYTEIINNHESLPMLANVDRYIYRVAAALKKMAICTGSSKREIEAVLAKLKQGSLQPYFSHIVTAEDVQKGKPSPEGYLLTAQRLGVFPEQCMVIEDTPHGVDAAKAAGMCTVAVLTSYDKNQLLHADMVVEGFTQMLELELGILE